MSWAEALLQDWFPRELDEPEAVSNASARWFGAAPDFDGALRARFAELPERAQRGEPAGWQRDARAALARVIALDQLPRNLYRGSARAFAFDADALAAARDALAAGLDAQLHPVEASFLYLPFEHAEELEAQQRSVQLFGALEARAPEKLRPLFAEFSDYARRHCAVIERFGRFPHRSAVLGRVARAEELAYLASGGEDFGAQPQGGAPDAQPERA